MNYDLNSANFWLVLNEYFWIDQLTLLQARFQEIQSRIHDIQSAVSEVQSNTQNLLVDVQQFLSHDNTKSDDTIPTSKTCVPRAKERLSFRNAELPSKNAVFLAECPHPDCANKIKTQFSRRKNLKRHYMSRTYPFFSLGDDLRLHGFRPDNQRTLSLL